MRTNEKRTADFGARQGGTVSETTTKKLFEVFGTIELNWNVRVWAESADEAENMASARVEDGDGLDIPVGAPEVTSVRELPNSEVPQP